MPQKVLKFTGINRKVNEYQNSGTCEELINLRPEVGGGHKIIKPKNAIRSNVPYSAFYEHSFGDTYNHIAVSGSSLLWINSPEGEKKIVDLASADVSFSSAGNILVVYCRDKKKQYAYKFLDKEYKDFGTSLTSITNVECIYEEGTVNYSVTAEDDSIGAYRDALYKASSGFSNKFPNGLCGSAVVSCAYELEDGSEVWSSAYIVAKGSDGGPSLYRDSKTIIVYGTSKVTLKLTIPSLKDSDVKKINVYATRPVYPYDVAEGTNSPYINTLTLDDENLGGQLMYYQGSVGVDKDTATLVLNFGTTQAGESILNINSGCVERIGETLSYNNRFHYFRSELRHIVQDPTVAITKAETQSELSGWIAFAEINGSWVRINKEYSFSKNVENDFIYPLAGVKRLAFVEKDKDSGDPPIPYQNMFYVDLVDSSAYNYSHAFGVTPNIVSGEEFYNEVEFIYPEHSVLYKNEVNTLNVSAPFNPFVFDVKHSYGFGGEIIDITTTYIPISSTKTDQSPLTVFTSNGIYSLGQGTGGTLYGNIEPLQPHVIVGKATATPYGTFFASSRNLYMLIGRESVMVSLALDGKRETELREQKSHKALCCNQNGLLFDFSDLLSKEDFSEFISNASMIYDQYKNEVIISSNDTAIKYSYVFNLDTKAYHKVSKSYLRAYNGARYVIEVDGNTKDIIDLHSEVDSNERPILLQSRPFSLEMLYSHIHRLQMFVDAKLEGGQNLCLSVFGSDNLYDWKCIISSQKQNTVLRQITTNRAAKSYKDYVILINGTVSTDTDLSEIIADYTVVSRRLG